MSTVSEAVTGVELEILRDLADENNWSISVLDSLCFVLGLPSRENDRYFVKCSTNAYPEEPPVWQWSDKTGALCGDPAICPKGSGYFHSSNVICAPWNRLAYKDRGGPHKDWLLAEWKSNPKLNGCDTLAHMALRILVELNSERYQSRLILAA